MADTVTYGRDPNGSLVKVPLSSPVGAVFFFAKPTPPEHALACDGAAVSRAAYPELFGAIGTTFGAGDGSTTFNLPDLRGKFVRGTGGNAAALGVAQGDAIRNISGQAAICGLGTPGSGWLPVRALDGVFTNVTTGGMEVKEYNTVQNVPVGLLFDASRSVPTADENRPANVALLPCIIFE